MSRPVCTIVGVGPGNGAAFASKFSNEGYTVALMARSRKMLSDRPDEFFLKPADIAESVFQLTRQPRSAWSFEIDLRPFCEKW